MNIEAKARGRMLGKVTIDNDNFKFVKRIEKHDNCFLPCKRAFINIGVTYSSGLEDPTKPL
jgi:hypothetical protein